MINVNATIPVWVPNLPSTLRFEQKGAVGVLTLARPDKRNAVNDETVLGIERLFTSLPEEIRAVVLAADGDHFCAGLDLEEVLHKAVDEPVQIQGSRQWHRVFDLVEHGPVPVISVLHGAVIGGGLELAAATHIRVAERSTFYALPEGRHGIFVGGGGSVRVSRLLGVARMTDLMLTGRQYDAAEGHAAGLSQYLVDPGEGLALALELAERIGGNARWSNFAVIQALPRIAVVGPQEGLFFESLTASFVHLTGESTQRVAQFFASRSSRAAAAGGIGDE